MRYQVWSATPLSLLNAFIIDWNGRDTYIILWQVSPCSTCLALRVCQCMHGVDVSKYVGVCVWSILLLGMWICVCCVWVFPHVCACVCVYWCASDTRASSDADPFWHIILFCCRESKLKRKKIHSAQETTVTERSKRFIVKEKRPERKRERGSGRAASGKGEREEEEREHDTEGENISSS